LYDFAVRLIMGSRESDWSLTTSQMTMEASMLGFSLFTVVLLAKFNNN
jgi:hypothetical protein